MLKSQTGKMCKVAIFMQLLHLQCSYRAGLNRKNSHLVQSQAVRAFIAAVHRIHRLSTESLPSTCREHCWSFDQPHIPDSPGSLGLCPTYRLEL